MSRGTSGLPKPPTAAGVGFPRSSSGPLQGSFQETSGGPGAALHSRGRGQAGGADGEAGTAAAAAAAAAAGSRGSTPHRQAALSARVYGSDPNCASASAAATGGRYGGGYGEAGAGRGGDGGGSSGGGGGVMIQRPSGQGVYGRQHQHQQVPTAAGVERGGWFVGLLVGWLIETRVLLDVA